MEPLKDELLSCLGDLAPRGTEIPLYSTVTGQLIDGMTLDAGYWWSNVRQPVQMATALSQLLQDGYDAFMQIGPHPVLSTAINECLHHEGKTGHVLTTLQRKQDERSSLLLGLGTLFTIKAQ